MNSVTTALVVEILQLAARYGIPAVLAIVQTWEKESITSEDVAELKNLIKHPDEYDK